MRNGMRMQMWMCIHGVCVCKASTLVCTLCVIRPFLLVSSCVQTSYEVCSDSKKQRPHCMGSAALGSNPSPRVGRSAMAVSLEQVLQGLANIAGRLGPLIQSAPTQQTMRSQTVPQMSVDIGPEACSKIGESGRYRLDDLTDHQTQSERDSSR